MKKILLSLILTISSLYATEDMYMSNVKKNLVSFKNGILSNPAYQNFVNPENLEAVIDSVTTGFMSIDTHAVKSKQDTTIVINPKLMPDLKKSLLKEESALLQVTLGHNDPKIKKISIDDPQAVILSMSAIFPEAYNISMAFKAATVEYVLMNPQNITWGIDQMNELLTNDLIYLGEEQTNERWLPSFQLLKSLYSKVKCKDAAYSFAKELIFIETLNLLVHMPNIPMDSFASDVYEFIGKSPADITFKIVSMKMQELDTFLRVSQQLLSLTDNGDMDFTKRYDVIKGFSLKVMADATIASPDVADQLIVQGSKIARVWVDHALKHKKPLSLLDRLFFMTFLANNRTLAPFLDNNPNFFNLEPLLQGSVQLFDPSTDLDHPYILQLMETTDRLCNGLIIGILPYYAPIYEKHPNFIHVYGNLHRSFEASIAQFKKAKGELEQKRKEDAKKATLKAVQGKYFDKFQELINEISSTVHKFTEKYEILGPLFWGIFIEYVESDIPAAKIQLAQVKQSFGKESWFQDLLDYLKELKVMSDQIDAVTIDNIELSTLTKFINEFKTIKTYFTALDIKLSQVKELHQTPPETPKKGKKKRNRKKNKNKNGAGVAGMSQAAVKVLEAEEVTPVVSQMVMGVPMPVEHKDAEPKVVAGVVVEPLESASASPALPSQLDTIESNGSKGSSSGEEVLKAMPGTDEPTTMRVRRDRDSKRLSMVLTPAELKAEKRKSRVSLSINPEVLKEKLALEERKLQRSQSTMNFKTAKADEMKERRLSRKLSVADLLREKKEKRASTRLTPGDIKDESKDMGPNGRIKTFHGDAEKVFQGAKADETDMAAHQLMMRLSTAKTLKKFKKELDPGNNFEKIKNPMSCLEGFIQNHKKPKVYSIRINSSSANRICIIMDKNKNYHIWYGDYH